MTTAILYIHGFNSSPASYKARQLQAGMRHIGCAEWLHIPALSHDPQQAIQQLDRLCQTLSRPVLVGSSLGGYYATWLAERHDLSALLINPAVRPHRSLADRLGPQQNFHSGERWQLTTEHLAALAELEVAPPTTARRYQVWLQTADEALDYRQAEQYYRHCPLRIQAGGEHGFRGFAERLPMLFAFAGLDARLWRATDFSAIQPESESL